MSRWYRAYADAHRNPKVAALSDKDFRLWHRLLSVAAENDGKIPPLDQLRLLLMMRLDYLKGGVERLLKAGLIDALTVGYEPHNWSKRQYKSDTSTDRVQKFRSKGNVSVTPPDTETETDTDTPPTPQGGECDLFSGELPPVGGEPPDSADPGEKYPVAFETWWSDYPNKTGKRKAAAAYEKAVTRFHRLKIEPARAHLFLRNALAAQKRVWKRKGIEGKYIPHPATWLTQGRYDDAAVVAERDKMANEPPKLVFVEPEVVEAEPARRTGKLKLAPVGWRPGEE